MPEFLREVPGRLFLIATLLPLLAFALLLCLGTIRRILHGTSIAFSRRIGWIGAGISFTLAAICGMTEPLVLWIPAWIGALFLSNPPMSKLYNRLVNTRHALASYIAVVCLMLAASCSLVGLSWFVQDAHTYADSPKMLESRWGERIAWLKLGGVRNDTRPAIGIDLGYRIDHLSAVMVTMVTVVGSLIFVFSLGYMKEERGRVKLEHSLSPVLGGEGGVRGKHLHETSHETHAPSPYPSPPKTGERGPEPDTREGRFGRFFLYLSLFAFAMLNILIADNLFQIFVGWELVGVSSFFLIGFYTERHSASTAANKAFLVNRIGDAGFLIGLAALWLNIGSFNLDVVFAKFASITPDAQLLIGLGILAGCFGKSAQVPLQTWLPDAMEGPTPVSALIHAATMVAAGVYLAARCFPLFTPEVRLVIAYCGALTMILSALIALVQTDIKRVLAYSTCSQLGFMMLALGLGAWTAALLHLLTHAFFKALLFLCAGSVIHGLHHEQDLSKMGGLRRKMPITAYTMLIGVLAIAGTPLFSGWYSKDLILGHVLGAFQATDHARPLLFVLPYLTAGLTAFYMFRLWFLAFAGKPRDQHAYEHAHESPAVMTLPLAILAIFSVGIAWGWPLWEAESSALAKLLHKSEPAMVHTEYAAAIHEAHEHHLLAGGLALGLAVAGFVFALSLHRSNSLLRVKMPNFLRTLFEHKFYFDELYSYAFTRPTLALASTSALVDKRTDTNRYDFRSLDGILNSIADAFFSLGGLLRQLQTGQLRTYITALGLTLAAGLGILWRYTK
jgi:NADH-quinone oxidoreductase subunit L